MMRVTLRHGQLVGHDSQGAGPLRAAIMMLLRAYQYAKSVKANRWHFALALEDFQLAGITRSEMRWLLATGLVLHAEEIVNKKSRGRTFAILPQHHIPPGTCFVLSDKGAQLLPQHNSQATAQLMSELLPMEPFGTARSMPVTLQPHRVPQWSPVRRELLVGQIIVKRFRCPAANQEAILAAFQEERWPPRIDDPLVPEPEQDPRRRLSDAIKCLNRKQVNPLVRFRSDGTGKGVLWELREEEVMIEIPLT